MPSLAERKPLFNELCEYRQRDLITLVTSTKQPANLFSAQIAGDLPSVFYDLLKGTPNGGSLDLFIYSAGGQVNAPLPLINLIREYYSDIYSIVPYRAHSAATLITLGTNKIGMSPMASLSPIDPQIQVKHSDTEIVEAGVEDIYGYYELIQDILKLDSSGKADALKTLSGRIHPEILGKITRTRREIRIIATRMLRLHIDDEDRISKIINHLVENLPSHQYMINRNEAKEIGLPVESLDARLEDISSKIMTSYIDEIGMEEPGLAIDFEPSKTTKVIEMKRAFIETKNRSFAFTTRFTFHRDGKVDQAINSWLEVTE